MTLRIQRTPKGIRLSVRVQPRASSNDVSGVHGDALKVRVTAPPVDGAANEAVAELLAGTFGIPVRAVTIVAGGSSRTKLVELEGVTEERVNQLLRNDARP